MAEQARFDPAAILPASLGEHARGCFTMAGPVPPVREDPYGSANLAHHVGDDPRRVAEARAGLAVALGLKPHAIAWMQQVHSTTVSLARARAAGEDEPVADALVLDRDDPACAGVEAVGVLVADCVPVLLASDDGRLVAAVHAGRRGMLDGVVARTLAHLAARGAPGERLWAAVGPRVCGRCYEVPEEMARDAARREPAAGAVSRWGTPAIDVAGAVEAQLRRGGVERIESSRWCTVEDERFYSYRRAAVTGRMAGVAVLAQ